MAPWKPSRRRILRLTGMASISSLAGNGLATASPEGRTWKIGDLSDERTADGRFVADDPGALDYFGDEVAVASGTAVVGAPADDGPDGDWAGSAYVFERSGENWNQQERIRPPEIDRQDHFGEDVTVSGDGNTVVVGAPTDEYDGRDTGSAFVFGRAGDGWGKQARLLPTDGIVEDMGFGSSVALSSDGNTAIVGGDTVHVFQRSGDGWTTEATLRPDAVEFRDAYGSTVALSEDGTTAFVGASWDDRIGTESGSVYVFRKGDDGWDRVANLTASDGDEGDHFGNAVALSGDTAVVGAKDDEADGSSEGAAYVFVESGGRWTERAKLETGGEGTALFGKSVAIRDDTILVGHPIDFPTGTVSVFERSEGEWTERRKLAPGDDGGGFGWSVATDNDVWLVGARIAQVPPGGGGKGEGAVYVFEADGAAVLREALARHVRIHNDAFDQFVRARARQEALCIKLDDGYYTNNRVAYMGYRAGIVDQTAVDDVVREKLDAGSTVGTEQARQLHDMLEEMYETVDPSAPLDELTDQVAAHYRGTAPDQDNPILFDGMTADELQAERTRRFEERAEVLLDAAADVDPALERSLAGFFGEEADRTRRDAASIVEALEAQSEVGQKEGKEGRLAAGISTATVTGNAGGIVEKLFKLSIFGEGLKVVGSSLLTPIPDEVLVGAAVGGATLISGIYLVVTIVTGSHVDMSYNHATRRDMNPYDTDNLPVPAGPSPDDIDKAEDALSTAATVLQNTITVESVTIDSVEREDTRGNFAVASGSVTVGNPPTAPQSDVRANVFFNARFTGVTSADDYSEKAVTYGMARLPDEGSLRFTGEGVIASPNDLPRMEAIPSIPSGRDETRTFDFVARIPEAPPDGEQYIVTIMAEHADSGIASGSTSVGSAVVPLSGTTTDGDSSPPRETASGASGDATSKPGRSAGEPAAGGDAAVVDARTLSSGETASYDRSLSSGTGRVAYSLADPGAALDVHLYDGRGNHVGPNYDTGGYDVEIPNARATASDPDVGDRSAELIVVDDPATSYRVEVEARDTRESHRFMLVEVTSPPEPPRMAVDPGSVDAEKRPGDVFEHRITVRETAGFEGLSNVEVTASALDHVSESATIPADDVRIDPGTLDVAPGGFESVTVEVSVPSDIRTGRYEGTVEMTATGVDGSPTETATVAVVVRSSLADPLPTARFDYSPPAPTAGTSVVLDASQSFDPGGGVTGFEWDLDDDGSFDRSGATPTVTFDDPGEYPITLRVTDEGGQTATSKAVLTVRESSGDEGAVDRADENDDGDIDDGELRSAIVDWAKGAFSDSELRDIVVEWST